MNTIQDLHAEVWQFRREMAAYFPTPSQADSLAFAFTEVAEAVDATLRQNPVYKRNNAKEHSVERELAQCAMMLLTAIPEGWDGWNRWTVSGTHIKHMGRVAAQVAELYDLTRYGEMAESEIINMWKLVSHIACLIDLPTHLRAELARMRAKHGPVQDNGPASLNAVENEHVVYIPPVEGLRLADWKEGSGL